MLSLLAFHSSGTPARVRVGLPCSHHGPLALHEALLAVAGRHLTRFDERVGTRTDNSMADNIGSLDEREGS